MKFAFISHGISDKAAEKLVELVGKKPSEIKIVYITTAVNTYPPDPDWFIESREQIKNIGVKLESFDLEEGFSENVNLEKYFSDVDVVFFSGGNTFYLLYWIYKTGFDKILLKLMGRKNFVYAGESAGVVCQVEDLTAVGWLDKPEEAPELPKTGLMFTDLVVVPHWGNPKYQEKLVKMKDYYEGKGLRVEVIEDNEAIFVDGDKVEKVV
jgi:dipeptidase E